MFPFLFQIKLGGFIFPVPTYGVIVLITTITCTLIVRIYARWEGFDPKKTSEGILFSALIGLIGGKVMEVLVSWEKILHDPKQFLMIMLLSGGVFLGGLISALVFGLWHLGKLGIPRLLTLDLVALTACLAMAMARWACFASGCCHGQPTTMPWGVTFPEIAHKLHANIPYGPIHPTQIYMSLNSAIIFIILLWVYRHKRYHGQIGTLYLFLYGIGRFIIEHYRGDANRGFLFGGLLSTSQFLCLFMIVGGAIGWILLARRHRLSGAPDWKRAPEKKKK